MPETNSGKRGRSRRKVVSDRAAPVAQLLSGGPIQDYVEVLEQNRVDHNLVR
jgi:hypothetical protein